MDIQLESKRRALKCIEWMCDNPEYKNDPDFITHQFEAFADAVRKEQISIDIKKGNEYLKRELSKLAMDRIEENFLDNEFKVVMKSDIPKWLEGLRKALEK